MCKFIEELLLILGELSVKKKQPKATASFVVIFFSQKPFFPCLIFSRVYLMLCFSAIVKIACAVSLVPLIKLIIKKKMQLETKSSSAFQLEKAGL